MCTWRVTVTAARSTPRTCSIHLQGGLAWAIGFRRNWLRVVAVADGPGLLEFAEPALLLAVLAAMGKGVVRRPWLHQREERLERRTHSVDVLDAHEGNLRVRVVLRSLVTLAARAVDVGVQLRPAVDNLQEGGCLVHASGCMW